MSFADERLDGVRLSAVLDDASLVPAPAAWTADAACIGLDGFTAARKPEPDELSVLRRVCRHCPVRRECGEYAQTWATWGFWSGRWHGRDDNRRSSAA